MGIPSWLYYLFGLVMLAVAAYAVSLLVLSVTGRHHSGRDVDLAHIFMGTSMAGMFVTKWAFGPSAVWELIFAALMVWFIVRTIQSVQRFGLHLPHEAIHSTMSFAMLLMYLYPMGATPGAMSMSMSSGAARLDPGLGFALAVTFFASAIFTLASPVKGASHHGAHALAFATIATEGTKETRSVSGHETSSVETVFTTPWLEDASHVVMCVAMGFMLILML
jgi:Domain of unknown function (DUF5134)